MRSNFCERLNLLSFSITAEMRIKNNRGISTELPLLSSRSPFSLLFPLFSSSAWPVLPCGRIAGRAFLLAAARDYLIIPRWHRKIIILRWHKKQDHPRMNVAPDQTIIFKMVYRSFKCCLIIILQSPINCTLGL